MILSTLASGASDPVPGQKDFIPTPCQEWAARNGATAEGIHQACSVRARAGTALHMDILSQRDQKLHRADFQPASVLSTL